MTTPLTLDTLKAMIEAMPKLPKLPPYYRCHPGTFYNLAAYLPKAQMVKEPPFGAVRIEQDTTVPLGEFWPPEGWKP